MYGSHCSLHTSVPPVCLRFDQRGTDTVNVTGQEMLLCALFKTTLTDVSTQMDGGPTVHPPLPVGHESRDLKVEVGWWRGDS